MRRSSSASRMPARNSSTIRAAFVNPWLARKDADWRFDRALRFRRALGATIVRTPLSRSMIDVIAIQRRLALSRPGDDGACPTTTFDGEPLYRPGWPRRGRNRRGAGVLFDPYHAALAAEIARLRAAHPRVALYDAHSIRSRIPRLFEGELPRVQSRHELRRELRPGSAEAIGALLATSRQRPRRRALQGRLDHPPFGRPSEGVEAVQLELACRAYMVEPEQTTPKTWPTPIDEKRAAPTREDPQARCSRRSSIR